MVAHETLVENWRLRLAEAERQIAHEPISRRWLPGIYARVYRFLLACYGNDEPRQIPADRRVSRMEFHDATVEDAGLAPKPTESIRATLGAIHEACGESAEVGPRADGHLQDSDWITVISESSHASPTACVRLLRHHGLRAQNIRQGNDTLVVVPAGQRDRAFRLVRDNRDALKLARQEERNTRTLCLAVLSILLLCLPTIVLCNTLWVLLRVGDVDFASLEHQIVYVVSAGAAIVGLCGLSLVFSRRR